jgi:hypothetical protein
MALHRIRDTWPRVSGYQAQQSGRGAVRAYRDGPSVVNDVKGKFHPIGTAVHIIPTFDFQRLSEGGATSAGPAPGARRG